jgi:SAM-dependent methyltransferase
MLSSPEGPVASSPEFARFLVAVARHQLDEWLPTVPSTILDLSAGIPEALDLMVERNHTVIHAESAPPPPARGPARSGAAGRLWTVAADVRAFDWLGDDTVDAVVAEGAVWSKAVAIEVTLDEVRRVLRPGGGLLLSVDSLVAGLARLADQERWAELADVPSADVVLVPEPDESISRCFWPEELHGLLSAAGFEVEWVRPRTVLTEQAVVRALVDDRHRLPSLVTTELALATRRQGESVGARLVASARKL